MNRYTIYCTEEQTRMALKLGAPIKTQKFVVGGSLNINFVYDSNINCAYKKPTAEQMISWLEEQGYVIHVFPIYRGNDFCVGYKYSCEELERNLYSNIYNSRKEATLAAIDAALEYLSNNK